MTSVSMLLGDVTSGYAVKNSLRFRSSASANLQRTFAAAPTTRTKQTFSVWFKRGIFGVEQRLFDCYDSTSTYSTALYLNSSNQLQLDFGGSSQNNVVTTQVFRDPSAWYHLVVYIDTTQATAANRIIFYINGSQVTSYATANYPAQNALSQWTINNANNRLGSQWSGAGYFDGYLAEVNFIDGQALTASSFGTYDINGVWQPINYSGSYGTNGFHLTFGNTTSTTTLGYDTSGNSNNWTTNNISLTAGSTYDSMTDSPTVTSASVANYAVLNPLQNLGSPTISNGNLQLQANANAYQSAAASMYFPTSGKWYFECNVVTKPTSTLYNLQFGIGQLPFISGGILTNAVGIWTASSNLNYWYKTPSGSLTDTGILSTNGDVVQFAYDASTGKVWAGYNNTWFLSGNPSAGTNPIYTYAGNPTLTSAVENYGTVPVGTVNFGQQGFKYTPPTGFNALNTYNLPTPTIANGAQYMAATTYTGNGSYPRSISNGTNNTIGTTFQPDFVWLKARNQAYWHAFFDSVRGRAYGLSSNSTNSETTSPSNTDLVSFDSGGFTVGTATNYQLNTSSDTLVGWQWKGGGTGVSNTNGSITSTVSANTTAGFSVVTYTGTGAVGTVGHGLGAAPSMIIQRARNVSAWPVYHVATGNTGVTQLQSTGAFGSFPNMWNNTTPSSTVFTLGSDPSVNGSGNLNVAYCWAAVAGYSAFGSYTGNGSSDGPFCYTGFRPRWIMFKKSSATSNWSIVDTSRDLYNVTAQNLKANTSAAEVTGTSSADAYLDILSNGFKLRGNSGDINDSTGGGAYIYAAFAENPFNYSRGR